MLKHRSLSELSLEFLLKFITMLYVFSEEVILNEEKTSEEDKMKIIEGESKSLISTVFADFKT